MQANHRDLIALPFLLVVIILMFLALPVFYVASFLGSRWTSETILKIFKNKSTH